MLKKLKYACRSYWWDIQPSLQRASSQFVQGWARRSLATFCPVRDLFRRIKPRVPESGPQKPMRDLPPRGSIVEIDGIRLRLHESLSDESVERIASGRHTMHERNLILDHLKPNDVVLELGGGVGMLATAIALKIGSERVFSFEGNPAVEPIARDNFKLNDVSPTMKFCILDRETGSQTFYMCEEFNRSSTTRVLESDIPVEVPVQPLNEAIQRIKPTFLIMDIQGSEDGLLEYVDFSGLSKFMVEYHPYLIGEKRTNQLRRFVRNQGFIEFNKHCNSILYIRP